MKAILVSNMKDKLESVYDEESLSKIRSMADLKEGFYTGADLTSGKEDLSDVELIFSTWGMAELSEEEIRRFLPKLKAVFYGAGTVQYFARPFLAAGVRIFSAWAMNAVAVAEYTVAEIILANKGFYQEAKHMTEGNVRGARLLKGNYLGNYKQKIGVIGAGMIGKNVIRLLRNYRLDVLTFDPFLPDETAEELGVKKASLEELFRECSVVTNHLANNDQTKGMIRGSMFESMLPYATFINTGRGAQIVEPEMKEVFAKRPDLTAVLDVTFPEPPVEGDPFYTLPNVFLTPHIAGSIGNEVWRMSACMADECELFLKGEKCRYEVTEKMLATMA